MHESSFFKGMLDAVARTEQEHGNGTAVRIIVELSEFGGWDEEHFREHFRQATAGGRWDRLGLEIRKVPLGPEARLVSVELRSS